MKVVKIIATSSLGGMVIGKEYEVGAELASTLISRGVAKFQKPNDDLSDFFESLQKSEPSEEKELETKIEKVELETKIPKKRKTK